MKLYMKLKFLSTILNLTRYSVAVGAAVIFVKLKDIMRLKNWRLIVSKKPTYGVKNIKELASAVIQPNDVFQIDTETDSIIKNIMASTQEHVNSEIARQLMAVRGCAKGLNDDIAAVKAENGGYSSPEIIRIVEFVESITIYLDMYEEEIIKDQKR